MSKPVLKNINFGTVNLEAYSPEIPHNFFVWLTLLIGPAGAEGGHLFQVGICTPTWLAHLLSREHICYLKNMLLVENFDFSLIQRKIAGIVDSSERATWEESVQVLARYFSWEFENPA